MLLSLLCAERERPLRRWREPGARRVARNVTVGAITAAAVAALESPMTGIVARAVERRRWGLMPRLRLPPAIALPVSIVLMDYTLYWW
ncbi:MAG TPA: fatty acid hydroxylase, partial [Casimicrobiaceae bacterium]|nr:fatty acid hydroxylase [Casimicrobiaceae bacterium]